MKLQLSLNDYIGKEKIVYFYIVFSTLLILHALWLYAQCSFLSVSIRTLFFSAIQVERCIFWKYKCNKRHIHCTIFPSAFYLIFFCFFEIDRMHTLSRFFSICPTLSWLHAHTHTNRFIHDDTQNELYLKAKWMLYYDAGSGLLPSLLLDFFSTLKLCFVPPLGRPYIQVRCEYLYQCSGFSLSFPTLTLTHTHIQFYGYSFSSCFTFNLVERIIFSDRP